MRVATRIATKGEAPMKLLFERIAVPMARAGTRGSWLRGRRVMAIDGLVLDVPATPDNDKEFGRSGNATAPSPFPLRGSRTRPWCLTCGFRLLSRTR